MSQAREVPRLVQQRSSTPRTAREHLMLLADNAYAKAERCRRRWHLARRASPPEYAARIRRQMLKHQALAYYLDSAFRGWHELR